MGVARKLAYLSRAEAFQWLPERLIRAHQRRRLQGLVSLCERRLPFYRARFARAGVAATDLRELDDLRRFPILSREEVVAHTDALRTRPPDGGDIVFRTSGSSGLFMEVAYSADANDYLDAVYARALFATGYRPWHRFAYSWWEEGERPSTGYERAGLMKKHLVPIDPDPRVQLDALRRIDPHYIYSFPSAMMQIARIIEREGRGSLAPLGVICHGELMPRPIGEAIEQAFGCAVWNQYGAQEFNRIGWDCEAHGPMHLDADSVILEVVDEAGAPVPDGVEGELVLTGLRNELMPLLRYRVGDVGRRVPGRCACGRGLPRFELTEGRRDDVLELRDGRRVGPRALAPKIEAVPGFTQYRLLQDAPGRFTLRVVPDAPPADLHARLERAVEGVLGEVELRIENVTEIPLNRRGKLRKIVAAESADR